MDASSRAGGSDLSNPGYGMRRSPSISSVASSFTSHGSILNHETIAKIGLDDILKMIHSAGNTKSNNTSDHEDTDEEFTLI